MGMKRFFADINNVQKDKIILTGMEHNHLRNVMRIVEGEEIIVVCGDEFDYLCKVEKVAKNETFLQILSRQENTSNPKVNLAVFQSLIKKQGMELTVQKLTELGVKKFIPFESKFSVVKAKEGKQLKLQEISNQSIKQCRRSIPMKVETPCSFKEMISQLKDYKVVLFANETTAGKSLRDYIKTDENMAIIIGPEGGFAPEEIAELEKVAVSVPMGSRILRAETASIAMASIVMFEVGEI